MQQKNKNPENVQLISINTEHNAPKEGNMLVAF